MNCRSCGTQFPAGAAYCPTCGRASFANVSDTEVSAGTPTLASSFPSEASGQHLATHYGSPSYGMPEQNLYAPFNPYEITPPPPRRRHVRVGLLLGIVVLVLALVSSSAVVFFILGLNQHTQGQPSQPTTTNAQTNLTATPTNSPEDIYTQATSGTPGFTDPLYQQDGNNWDESNTPKYGCAFRGAAYHVTIKQSGFVSLCFANATTFSNFAFQTQMAFVAGDGGGLAFRNNGREGYRFAVRQDGSYDLVITQNNGGTTERLLSGTSSAIYTGLNMSNTLAVVAEGSNIYLYVNEHYLASVTDTTSTSGKIGLFAYDATNPTEMVFLGANVWTL